MVTPRHEIKRSLLLGRKVITNLDSILKSRDITLSTKVRLVKAMVFPVVMYGCESWTIKTYGHGERGGEGEMYGKNNMETYITICKIDSQQEFAVWLRKLKQGLCQSRGVGWGGRWEGGSNERGYMYTCG